MWGDDDLRADEERLAKPGDCPQCLSSAVPCYCEMSAIVGMQEEDDDAVAE